MRACVQRVARARVSVQGEESGAIGPGLLVLVGIEAEDGVADIDWLCRKISQLRVFNDGEGVMNRSLLDLGADVLAVSQFTLYACLKKGNRPSYSRAAPPEIARPLFDRFVQHMAQVIGRPVPTGVFGADMQVELINDGPVTLWLDSKRPE